MSTQNPTRRDELRALTGLGLGELGRATRGIARVHESISNGVFAGLARTPLRPWTQATRTVHDSVSRSVYATVATGFTETGQVAAKVVDLPGRTPSTTPRGAAVIGVVNGLIGDELSSAGSPLAGRLGIRVDGEPVAPTPDALRRAFPDARPHLVIFIHGLMETEYAWRRGGLDTYGQRMRTDLGATDIYLRYNTGRHVSDNGAELCALLTDLVRYWPTPVGTISLVGHSMGGLVIRSACHIGSAGNEPWTTRLRHTVSLGTPHLGAPLARGVHLATVALRSTPVTRPVGDLLRRRSAGVRDLFHGHLIADDWRYAEPDILRQPPGADIPLSPGVRHLYVTATVTRDPRHPVGRVIGDGLVLTGSGSGRGRHRTVGYRLDDGMHLGGANHFTLLNNEQIYTWLRARLAPPPALPPPDVTSCLAT